VNPGTGGNERMSSVEATRRGLEVVCAPSADRGAEESPLPDRRWSDATWVPVGLTGTGVSVRVVVGLINSAIGDGGVMLGGSPVNIDIAGAVSIAVAFEFC
jgi:hypothetical protein